MALAAVGHWYHGQTHTSVGNYTLAVIAVEYFDNWVEVKPVTNITSATIQKFFF
jgi:hypothetical protein